MTPQDMAAMMQEMARGLLATVMPAIMEQQAAALRDMQKGMHEGRDRDRGIHDSKAISKIQSYKGA